MGRVVALTLLAFALAPLHAAPQHVRSTTKKSTTAVSTHRTPVRVATVARAHSASAARTGRGRWARGTRVVHAAPAPTYQLHPDPDRYQVIQKALAERGYFKGESNGAWGDDSGDALRRFQADQKIDNDGKIDALSLIALGLGPRHDGSTAAVPRVLPSDGISSSSPVQSSIPAAPAGGQPR